tara:strand:- start:122 stop:856 length:735 start_codon:yes stop_codon:yes gene_type:complete
MAEMEASSDTIPVELFRSSDEAILSTLSKSTQNYPFGSFVTFVSNTNRDLILYASDIAQHTANFTHDSRACITICGANLKQDKQDRARLSLIGDITKISDEEVERLGSRFFKLFPNSTSYARVHGFHFYLFKSLRVRWIGGFGQIAWLDEYHWRAAAPQWTKDELAMINHMNEDHRNVICSALNAIYGVIDPQAKMLALCSDGYYATSCGARYFIGFGQPCYTGKDVRKALVHQAESFRSFELS